MYEITQERSYFAITLFVICNDHVKLQNVSLAGKKKKRLMG